MKSILRDAAAVSCLVANLVVLLLYVQLGFIERLQRLDLGATHTHYVLAAMAIAGFTASLTAPLLLRTRHPVRRLQAGFGISFLSITLSITVGTAASLAVAAAGMGLGVSLTCVSLLAAVRPWVQTRRMTRRVGLGTGLAYAVCSVPQLFFASPEHKGIAALAACSLGVVSALEIHEIAPPAEPPTTSMAPRTPNRSVAFGPTLLIFFALIWLDSGAFSVIVNHPVLKAASWGTHELQWRNSALHLASAVAGAWLIERGWLRSTLTLCYLTIAFAISILQRYVALASLASAGYVCAASLYTVALFAFAPFCLAAPEAGARLEGRWVLFALATWAGSTLGIGVMQALNTVPTWIIIATGTMIGAGLVIGIESKERPAKAARSFRKPRASARGTTHEAKPVCVGAPAELVPLSLAGRLE